METFDYRNSWLGSTIKDEKTHFVSWIAKIKTKRDGKKSVYRKTLVEVLDSQTNMLFPDNIDLNDDNAVLEWKIKQQGMFSYDICEENAVYNDDLVVSAKLKGTLVFLDVDNVDISSMLWAERQDMKDEIPSMVAMWFSVRDKLHLAFSCKWTKKSGYRASWEFFTNEIYGFIKKKYSADKARIFKRANDYALMTPIHCLCVCYTKAYEYWNDSIEYDSSVFDTTPYEYLDLEDVEVDDAYSLFSDSAVKKKFISVTSIESFVKWYEKNRGSRYRTTSKDLVYDKHIVIEDETLNYWLNDNDYYALKYNTGWKLSDFRKRAVNSASKFFACVMGYSFEDCLHCVCKYYIDTMNKWQVNYEVEKHRILNRVAKQYANQKKNSHNIGYFRVKKEVIVDRRLNDRTPEDPYYNTKHNCISGGQAYSKERKIKNKLREQKLCSLYIAGDDLKSLYEKMVVFYPKISIDTVKRVAKQCGIVLNKQKSNKQKSKKKYEYDYYVNCYSANGERSRKPESCIDNVNWFRTKKDLKKHIEDNQTNN